MGTAPAEQQQPIDDGEHPVELFGRQVPGENIGAGAACDVIGVTTLENRKSRFSDRDDAVQADLGLSHFQRDLPADVPSVRTRPFRASSPALAAGDYRDASGKG
jgi:hypothetical protein